MAAGAKQTCYEGSAVQRFQFFLEQSGEHEAVLQSVRRLLPGEFKRIGAAKSGLDVLGVGSGGALVAKTTDLQKISFAWHIMHSGDYEKQVEAKGDVKKFDFIHMIQMLYYVENLTDTIKFYHNLLKSNGRLMIIIEAANAGWDTLWKTYKKELCVDAITEYCSSGEVVASVKSLGLKYEEHTIHNTFDITECFDPSSATGECMLSFMTAKDHFYQSFTPEIRAGVLDLLRNKCCADKGGRLFFDSSLSCILVHA
ncbi:putative histamine N-methyltransferase A-like [Scophthalmus maximus]|uniref:Putative histamine N-methyltransferase A-like n=1 Tax=Scophthalmus maximus TaxID=52904 RepID=A0A2U9C832_SCOMX|nr:putative histamine N-methyltransferase A-like [Scophthalmus maximus]